MGGVCGTRGDGVKCVLWYGKVKERNDYEDPRVDGTIALKWVLQK